MSRVAIVVITILVRLVVFKLRTLSSFKSENIMLLYKPGLIFELF